MSEDTGTLKVLPNPYAALDAKGRPCGAFPLEGMSGRERYVGVEVDHARTKKIGKRVFQPAGFVKTKDTTEADVLAAWANAKPVDVPHTTYYRLALKGQDNPAPLLPADAETAKAVGLPADALVGAAALDAARKAAANEFRRRFGVSPAIDASAPAAAPADDKPAPKKAKENAP